MIKRMIIMLLAVGILFGGIFGYKAFQSSMMKKSMSMREAPAVTVSTMKAGFQNWQPRLYAVGNLIAVRGVEVTSEIPGLVRAVQFNSGDEVKEGQLLVQLNADPDFAQLRALQEEAQLAQIVYDRDKLQFTARAISKAALDADEADLKSKREQVLQQKAIVEKKSIRAPFAGKLGITAVRPGQYLNAGDKIVSLQALDPIYVDFYLPQQQISRISTGQTVFISVDTYPGRSFSGKITAVNPEVDLHTRNILVEATFDNPKHELLPGMYATVEVHAGNVERYLTLPQTAVTYNSYGDTVFTIKDSVATQKFVSVGESRGDQIAIIKGIEEGETVVTSGQIKLRNASKVIVNNQVQPSFEAAPEPTED